MTLISHRRKFIFVHARKTGGTSLQISLTRWLGEDGVVSITSHSKRTKAFNRRTDTDDFGGVRQRRADRAGCSYDPHAPPDEIRRKVGETVWASYFKFTVARNPWDLLVSMLYFKHSSHYYWRDVWTGRKRSLRDAVGNLPRAFRTLQLRREFARGRWKESVEAILQEGLYHRQVKKIPWFYFSRGEACMDYVIRFENLQQGYDEACRRLGLPLQTLPRTNSRLRPAGDDYRDYYTDFSREYVADLCRPMIDAFGYRFDDGR